MAENLMAALEDHLAGVRREQAGRDRKAPPPPCITCNRFVDIKTARRIPEYGDYGALLNTEFECARCVAESRNRAGGNA